MSVKLLNMDKKRRDSTSDEFNNFLYAEGIPSEKAHDGDVSVKHHVGVIRKIERYYLSKSELGFKCRLPD